MASVDDTLALLREYRETQRLSGIRMWTALMLSPTPEIWFTLLRGEPVPTDQLDHQYLRRARSRLRGQPVKATT